MKEIDINGYIIKYINQFNLILQKLFYYVFNIIGLFFKKVSYGKRCIFLGTILIKRSPRSIIKIGDYCDFRSRQPGNLIGINRRCSFSTMSSNSSIIIGNNCGFSGTVIAAFSEIELGNNIKCGANSLITDSNWHLDDPRSGSSKPIKIYDNVWIGVNAIILKGVTIGKNSVIGANSVITKDIPPNVVVAGNPSVIVRNLSNKEISSLEK